MADKNFSPGDIEQVWYRDSDVPGPTALILGGIHGNERPGIEVVKRMISGEFNVPLERGRLIVALGNLAAIDANVRWVDTNLNREFRELDEEELERQAARPAYEVNRAQALMPVLNEAGSSLDLHAFRQKDSKPFIISEPRGFQAASSIGVPYVSSGWSTIERGGSDGYMDEQSKTGLCYELAQLEDLKQGIPRGEQGVLRFLEHMQLIEMTRDRREMITPQFIHATKAVLAQPGFTWGPGYPYRSFQALRVGELIAQNGVDPDDAIHAGDRQVIIFPSSDAAPKPGDEMFNIGTIIEPPPL